MQMNLTSTSGLTEDSNNSRPKQDVKLNSTGDLLPVRTLILDSAMNSDNKDLASPVEEKTGPTQAAVRIAAIELFRIEVRGRDQPADWLNSKFTVVIDDHMRRRWRFIEVPVYSAANDECGKLGLPHEIKMRLKLVESGIEVSFAVRGPAPTPKNASSEANLVAVVSPDSKMPVEDEKEKTSGSGLKDETSAITDQLPQTEKSRVPKKVVKEITKVLPLKGEPSGQTKQPQKVGKDKQPRKSANPEPLAVAHVPLQDTPKAKEVLTMLPYSLDVHAHCYMSSKFSFHGLCDWSTRKGLYTRIDREDNGDGFDFVMTCTGHRGQGEDVNELTKLPATLNVGDHVYLSSAIGFDAIVDWSKRKGYRTRIERERDHSTTRFNFVVTRTD